jgi:adenine-specific DNA-methyltransferase
MSVNTTKRELGQYFTKDITLQQKVFEFMKNEPRVILEPSMGRGDLVQYVLAQDSSMSFDLYEIDNSIEILPGINSSTIVYGDFLEQEIDTRYQTIIGNPPYVKTRGGNLYIDFIDRCFNLLQDDGEMIFIVPSDFLKLTCAATLLNTLLSSGLFTHIYHPNDEHLFEEASIDVIVFRYQKTPDLESICLYNDCRKFIVNNDGMITFCDELQSTIAIQEYFDVYVGMVSGKESVYKSSEFGNIKVLNAEGKCDSYVFLKEFPSVETPLTKYLQEHKALLIERRIRKFTDINWYQWGAPRNISIMEKCGGEDCIYIYNLTRKSHIAFIGKVQYFGGNLIMLKPKSQLNLIRLVEHFNSDAFKTNFEFSGRFKIGQRQLSNMRIPETLFIN